MDALIPIAILILYPWLAFKAGQAAGRRTHEPRRLIAGLAHAVFVTLVLGLCFNASLLRALSFPAHFSPLGCGPGSACFRYEAKAFAWSFIMTGAVWITGFRTGRRSHLTMR